MEQKTYEIIIEALVDDLEMERWKLRKAQEELEATRSDLALAKKIIDDLQKTVNANG